MPAAAAARAALSPPFSVVSPAVADSTFLYLPRWRFFTRFDVTFVCVNGYSAQSYPTVGSASPHGMETSSDTSAPQGFDTDAMARLVRHPPPEQLKEGLRVNRDVLIGEIFRRFPERLTSEGRKVTGAIKWKITGREDRGADRWFLVLENGEARTGRDLDVKPRVTLTMDALTFLQVVTGNANPVELFIRRKVKVKGDLLFAARMERLFKVPRSR